MTVNNIYYRQLKKMFVENSVVLVWFIHTKCVAYFIIWVYDDS